MRETGAWRGGGTEHLRSHQMESSQPSLPPVAGACWGHGCNGTVEAGRGAHLRSQQMNPSERSLPPRLVHPRVHQPAGVQAAGVHQLAQVAHRGLELGHVVQRRRRQVRDGTGGEQEDERLGRHGGRLDAKRSVHLR
jgi:hypothetical protein